MNCLFCDIAAKRIPATVVFEDEHIIAFRDITPQAPVHLLVIPKEHIGTINDIEPNHEELLGKMITTAKRLAHDEGLSHSGYRLLFNTNADGGQTVYHIHLHLLGGRKMTWPPG